MWFFDALASGFQYPTDPGRPQWFRVVDETVRLVEEAGGESVLHQADVRDQEAVTQLVQAGMERFGRIDAVLPTAGITSLGPLWELDDAQWHEMVGINLTGVWRTHDP